mmetsp:Transcript_49336/g.96791  ORF Transcript_49336/g.96791 Transcript_49336/m.96791 type:complete len:115 (-) Transcript_49336:301-645(-)|eukprot:CAMPEP_0175126642 /NCGR_PEP_ID=MMETSP0087-20121206/3968_1 /TAXON_ID=136419 /ORGANISM="Unknown Unknown, Strain D1" /LENGTH=114 /DNA_ID=CAMNT_0016408579 /DNA_START=197 /DNA_END=541 /DNA_ORIENTATION=-
MGCGGSTSAAADKYDVSKNNPLNEAPRAGDYTDSAMQARFEQGPVGSSSNDDAVIAELAQTAGAAGDQSGQGPDLLKALWGNHAQEMKSNAEENGKDEIEAAKKRDEKRATESS